MLCPECRRMVSKDGYCPQGHLARPDWQEQAQTAAAPPAAPLAPPPPPPASIGQTEPAQTTSPGTTWVTPSPVPSTPSQGAPPLPPAPRIAKTNAVVKALVAAAMVGALVVVALTFLGTTAGAANLKLVFQPGETHTYSFEVTVRGSAGNLQGAFTTDQAIAADLTQETGAIAKDGSAKLTFTIRNIHFTEGGRSIDAPPGVGGSFSARIRPNGRIVGIDGGDPFGLEDINPVGSFVNPANAGPLLPDRHVKPGQSWTIQESQELPDVGKLSFTATNTLQRRMVIDGNEAAEIDSVVKVPLDLGIGYDELVRQAKNDGEPTDDIPKDAGVTMTGVMDLNMTQVIYTANGLLQSAIGDGTMRGTMRFTGLPIGSLDIVFNIKMGITVTKKSTGLKA
jgi:hypothetical protein